MEAACLRQYSKPHYLWYIIFPPGLSDICARGIMFNQQLICYEALPGLTLDVVKRLISRRVRRVALLSS